MVNTLRHDRQNWIAVLFSAMRWLLIGLLVSLGVLLFAAAGVARHIWLQHVKLRQKPSAGAAPAPDLDVEP
jgi:hypothetical protein